MIWALMPVLDLSLSLMNATTTRPSGSVETAGGCRWVKSCVLTANSSPDLEPLKLKTCAKTSACPATMFNQVATKRPSGKAVKIEVT